MKKFTRTPCPTCGNDVFVPIDMTGEAFLPLSERDVRYPRRKRRYLRKGIFIREAMILMRWISPSASIQQLAEGYGSSRQNIDSLVKSMRLTLPSGHYRKPPEPQFQPCIRCGRLARHPKKLCRRCPKQGLSHSHPICTVCGKKGSFRPNILISRVYRCSACYHKDHKLHTQRKER